MFMKSTTKIRRITAVTAAAVLLCPTLLFGNAASAELRSDDARSDRDRHEPQHHSDDDHDRRAGGECTTTFQFTGINSVHIDGTCSLRHLRHATLQADQTITPNPDGTVSAVNDSVYTSANGDELHSHFVGTGTPLSPTELMLTGIETYDGGTGRFEDAEGSATLTGRVMFTSATGGTGAYTTQGMISF